MPTRSYCYCVPRRDLTATALSSTGRQRYAVGQAHPQSYYSWMSTYVMGTRGFWVDAASRNASIKGWQTRRARMALEAAEVREVQAPDPEPTTTAVEPMVIGGTVPETTTPIVTTPEPVALTVSR